MEKSVYVLKELIGMVNGANLMDVLEDKYGMDLLVNANLNIILMEKFVYFVSMVKNGTFKKNLVNVQQIIHGMETIVKKKLSAQEIEFGINNINNVSALQTIFGMDLDVWLSLIAVVEKYGILKLLNVIVPHILTGMVHNVFIAWMASSGMKNKINVFAEKAQTGMDNFVLWSKIVMEVWYGTKIHGLVNALQLQYGMEIIVLRIHAMEGKYGIIISVNVFA